MNHPGPPGDGAQLGAYRLLSSLGAGGMGTVFLASVEGDVPGVPMGERVAIKVVHPHLVTDFQMFERFVREASLGKRIRHENVVRTLDAGLEVHDRGEWVYLVMEYVRGRTLADVLDEERRLPEERCRRLAREVARALRGIHEMGVVHGDLKPENVIATPQGVVKVMDLGLAQLRGEALHLSKASEFAGSVLYAAPEQFGEDSAILDPRADLYSLGVTLYHLASGVHPFAHEDVRVVVQRQVNEIAAPLRDAAPDASEFFEELVARLMEKDPARRIRSADELFAILSEAEESRWWRKRSATAAAAERHAAGALRVPRDTEVHGRERELVALRRAHADTKTGRGRTVLLVGESGCGKTRLVDEFLRLLETAGESPRFLTGSFRPDRPGHDALSAALRRHLGAEELQRRLGDRVGGQRGALGAYESLLGQAVEAGFEEPENEDDLPAALISTVAALAAEAPLVLLLEDLHAAPQGGRELFFALARIAPTVPLLLIGTAGRGLSARWRAELEALPRADLLRVERLPAAAVGALLSDALETGRAAESFAAALTRLSDGNPRVALSVLRDLQDAGRLRRTPGGEWELLGSVRDVPIPADVEARLRPRLAALTQDDRDLLEVAACLGRRFDPALLGEVAGLDRRRALAELSRLEREHHVVRRRGERFEFDGHGLWRQMLGEMLPALAQEYHRMIADVLGSSGGATPSELCRHLLLGDAADEALPHLDRALAELDAAARHEDLIELANAALGAGATLEGAARAKALVRKSLSLSALGRKDAAADALREALPHCGDMVVE